MITPTMFCHPFILLGLASIPPVVAILITATDRAIPGAQGIALISPVIETPNTSKGTPERLHDQDRSAMGSLCTPTQPKHRIPAASLDLETRTEDSRWSQQVIEAKIRLTDHTARPRGLVSCGQGADQNSSKTKRTATALPNALDGFELAWLRAYQSEAGSWDADGYPWNNLAKTDASGEGAGDADQDLAVTSLACLAMIAEGVPKTSGATYNALKRAIKWLGSQQDYQSGRIGSGRDREALLQHTLATLAIAENYRYSKNPFHKLQAQRALNYLSKVGDSQAGWPYSPDAWQERDTVLAGWILLARKCGTHAGLKVTPPRSTSLDDWLRFWRTRVVSSFGSQQSRRIRFPVPNHVFHLVHLQAALEEEPVPKTLIHSHQYSVEHFGAPQNPHVIYFGTLAAHQLGGKVSSRWRKAVLKHSSPKRQKTGEHAGSWDPDLRSPIQQGRVASTALHGFILASLFRYSRMTGM